MITSKVLIVHSGQNVDYIKEAVQQKIDLPVYTGDVAFLYQTLYSFPKVLLVILTAEINPKTVKKTYRDLSIKPYTIWLSTQKLSGPKVKELFDEQLSDITLWNTEQFKKFEENIYSSPAPKQRAT